MDSRPSGSARSEALPPDPSPGGAAAARPFVWLAGALGAGTWLGLQASDGAGVAASAVVAGLAALGWLAARRGLGPSWAAWVLVLAFARASALERPPPRSAALTALAAAELRAAPLAGRWRANRDGRTGWIEPFQAPGDASARAGADTLLLEPEGFAPEEGTPVVLLPGSEAVAWARGPEASPSARSGRFAAHSSVLPDELVRLGPAPRAPWAGLVAALRELRAALGARAAALEGESSAGLLRALAIGARDGLPRERIDLFARTGTSHLLAISGWHVGLFAILVVLPLARAFRRGWKAFALRMLLLGLFAGVAGAEKPVLRAALALVFLQLAWLRPRGASAADAPPRPDGLSSLAAAFALECLFDPAGIDSLSLALSYAATLGLMLGTGALARALRPADEGWPELAPGRCARLVRILGARLLHTSRSGLAASLAAVLATLPLTWTTFGEFAPTGALWTLLALVPFTFLSVLAWVAALVPTSAHASIVGAGFTLAAELGARALYAVLELGDALPWTPLVLPPRPAWALALATALAFLGLRRAWARRAALLAFGLLLLPWSAAPAGLELHALDVGHGSALVLRAPGLEALVFDAGSRDRRAVTSEALVPLLARWEVARPTVVLSHPDHDHAAGLGRLLERYPVATWLGAEPAQGLVRWPHGLERVDLAPGRLHLAAACPRLELSLLRGAGGEGNEGSRALEIVWRGQRLLLLGDAEEGGLAGLELAPGPLRLLLAPHHGSDGPALWPWLGGRSIQEVWISSAGRPGIAPELERRALTWRWTGRDGPLALRLR